MTTPPSCASLLSGSPTPTPKRHPADAYFEHASRNSTGTARPYVQSSPPGMDIPSSYGLRERRSSASLGDRILNYGGVNSIDNFARSWTRAANFPEIAPSRQSFVSASPLDEEALENAFIGEAPEAELSEEQRQDASLLYHTFSHGSYGSYGSFGTGIWTPPSQQRMGGTLPSGRIGDSMDSNTAQAARLFLQDQKAAEEEEREPLLVKTVTKEDGITEAVVVGQSTLPQTVFNSVNVLIGIGLLSLPLGLQYSGWLIGLMFLLFAAVVTNYTAKLLAKCLDRAEDKTLVTYSDIAYIAFGQRSRIVVSILFSMELVAACVALVVLFADSLHGLFPGLSVVQWKIIAGIVLTPLSFLPLRVLSFSSVIGILCTFSLFTIVLIDGLLKPTAPGSLRDPMPTYLLPSTWSTVPLSFGLLMSPWGGHGVFPNIYKDMRHPYKYARAIDMTYGFTYLLDLGMAVIGLLMFGDGVLDEITGNILTTPGYPRVLGIALVVFIAIIPLTKTPLNARPIITTLEILLGLNKIQLGADQSLVGKGAFWRGVTRALVKVGVNVAFVGIAVVLPSFDRIMAFMGSALCFSICVILPIAFYLKIFGHEVGRWERRVDYMLVTISSVMAVVGTVWAFLPRDDVIGRRGSDG